MYAASPPRLRNGFGGATTVRPLERRSAITPFQLDASANAPCTRNTVGVVAVVSARLMLGLLGFGAVDPDPTRVATR
jgi:hypothetical protein